MASAGKAILYFEGDSKQLNNELNKVESNTNSKMSSVGKSIGSAFMAGAAVAGTALTGIVAASIKAYADMEQNLGGVETLFKDSADTVISNAKKAYESAGMSANEYMETVTSFSASLLQGLGGDTEKAAAIADMAVTDMADNANKMGTSMELIQNAYQGFAKQNYTMLDNLKLGYGGTQAEMARLINDSGVLGDTMTVTAETVNQVSFDKMIEAIHVIQDEMGITGTTSKEAASTITGSLSSAKSAWENFLSGAGGIDAVVSTFTTAGTNIMNAIIKMAPQITQGLIQLLNSLIPQIPVLLQQLLPVLVQGVVGLVQGLVTALPQILTVLAQMLPTIVTTLVNGFIQIANSLAEQMPTIIPIIVNALMQGLLALLTNAPELIQCAVQLILGLSQGLINAIPILISYLPQIITSVVSGLLTALPQLMSVGIQLIAQLAVGLIKAIPQIIGSIPRILSAIFNGLKSGIGNMASIGLDLVKGLWNGIKDATGWILDKIKGFGKSVLNGIKDFFGIHSPSTEFAWIGKMNVVGLNEGMEDMKGTVQSTFDDIFDLSPQVKASASTYFSPQTNVVVNNQFETDPLGQVVNRIKSVSGGARSDYNVGMGANA